MASCARRIVQNLHFILMALLMVYVILAFDSDEDKSHNDEDALSSAVGSPLSSQNVIHLSVVACEGETKRSFYESLTMMKSALIFTNSPLHFHIFTETLELEFKEEFLRWPKQARTKFEFTVYPVKYPLSPEDVSEFKNWWGPCASFRLFLPEILKDLDALIYVDSDVLFLGPVDDVWGQFSKLNKHQVGALAPRVGWEFKVPSSNPNFIPMPNGQHTQVNSGVFLMNLTRMRENRFETDPQISTKRLSWNQDLLLPLYRGNKKDMYGDQNLINVVFHYNPQLLYFLPCKYNYHHKFCFDKREDRSCVSAEKEGAAAVHGSANTFYNNYSPAFAAVNDAMKLYNFEEDLSLHLFRPIVMNLRKTEVELHEHCGGKTELFTRHLRKHVLLQKTFSTRGKM